MATTFSHEHYSWCQSDLLRLVSSYLSVEDLLALEKICLFFHQCLSALDVDGIWKQLEEMTIIEQRIDSFESSKKHLVMHQKAKIFADNAEKSGMYLHGMGSDVVHELFHGNKESREASPKSGYHIFVRVTKVRSNQVIYQGFVEELFGSTMEELTEEVPLEKQYLQLVIGRSLLVSKEFRKLSKSFKRVDNCFAFEAMKKYVNSLDATVVVVHETLPSRLVCCASGFPNPFVRGVKINFLGMPKPTCSNYFPTQHRLVKNVSFGLNGAPHALACRFGVFTFCAADGHFLACLTIALSFERTAARTIA